MDPTAPKNKDQSTQTDENQEQTPVQTGGFVVSGEPGVPTSSSQQPQQATPPDPQSPQPAPPPAGEPATQGGKDLQSDLQSTVAAATGEKLAGNPEPVAPAGDNTLPPEPPAPPAAGEQQPDPTPFANPPSPGGAPPAPSPTQAPQSQSSQTPGGSNTSKMKSLIIVIAVFILVAILAAVAWYFILNTGQAEEDSATTDTRPIELAPSPTPRTEGGFGDLPDPTPEATSPAEPEEGDSQEEILPPGPPVE